MKTAVVILNWNTKDYLLRFVPGILDSLEGQDAGLIVADSASTDGSLEALGERFHQIRQIPLDNNYGFTGGYNRALMEVDAEYYVLLNSDIEVPKGWLTPLVDWMDSHPDCGVCGPKLHSFQNRDCFEYAGAAGGYIDRFGYPYCRGRVLKRLEKDFGQYDSPKDVLWVSGAALMVRSSLWKTLGGLDDRFFAHMEEIDFCWRAVRAGWKVTVVPDSVVWHLGGGTLSPDSPWKLQLNYRNNLLLLDNNLPGTIGKAGARAVTASRKVLDYLAAIAYFCTGKRSYAAAVLRAHRQYRMLRSRTSDSGKADVPGYGKTCILLQSVLRGKGIFNYLRRYEDSH